MRIDCQRDSQAGFGIAAEDRDSAAWNCAGRELLKSLLQSLRREGGQVLEDGAHVTAASVARSCARAIRRRCRSLNHGRNEIRAGARWPYTRTPSPGRISRRVFAGARLRKLTDAVVERP